MSLITKIKDIFGWILISMAIIILIPVIAGILLFLLDALFGGDLAKQLKVKVFY